MSRAHGSRLLSARVLNAITITFLAAAAIFVSLPTFTDVAPAEIRVATIEARSARGNEMGGALDSAARAIVRTNAFSASRREPTARFAAPGIDATPMASYTPPPTEAAGVGEAEESGPRLFGIVSTDGTLRALVQLRAADGVPRLMSIGETAGGIRIRRIDTDRVVISSSSGTRTLRLSRAVPDSLDHVP